MEVSPLCPSVVELVFSHSGRAGDLGALHGKQGLSGPEVGGPEGGGEQVQHQHIFVLGEQEGLSLFFSLRQSFRGTAGEVPFGVPNDQGRGQNGSVQKTPSHSAQQRQT